VIAMMDKPTLLEIVTAVREFIEQKAIPALSGHTAFHARVAANVVATVRREIELGPAQARWVVVALRVPPQAAGAAATGAQPIVFRVAQLGVSGAPGRELEEKSTFVIPR
jgi:hypothetical protein